MKRAHPDHAAVAACAQLAGIDHQRADAAMLAADMYWLAAMRVVGSAELQRTCGVGSAELEALRRRHADIFGRRRAKPPDGRRLVLYLRRTTDLSPAEAERFAAAHAMHLQLSADDALTKLRKDHAQATPPVERALRALRSCAGSAFGGRREIHDVATGASIDSLESACMGSASRPANARRSQP